jgi:hypothetical protein
MQLEIFLFVYSTTTCFGHIGPSWGVLPNLFTVIYITVLSNMRTYS